MKLASALLASALLAGSAFASTSTSVLDFSSGLGGWTTAGTVTLLSTTDSFIVTNEQDFTTYPYSLTPASGESMVKITPPNTPTATPNPSAFDAALGLSAGTIAGHIGSDVTSFGMIQKSFTLSPGTYTFSWAYAAYDYLPYNDGALFAITGEGQNYVRSLIRNGTSGSDVSGPDAGTMVVGSYGATSWQTASFNVISGGNYTLSFATYNWDDGDYNPVFYVSGSAGSFTGDDIATPAVPEPSSFAALAGLAVLGLVATRRRRAV